MVYNCMVAGKLKPQELVRYLEVCRLLHYLPRVVVGEIKHDMDPECFFYDHDVYGQFARMPFDRTGLVIWLFESPKDAKTMITHHARQSKGHA